MSERALAGMTVLLVEDDPLIGMDLAMTFEEAGAIVRGPFPSVTTALTAIRDTGRVIASCAVLDYELGQETSEEIALLLCALSIPIVFHTGSSKDVTGLAIRLDAPIVSKPSDPGRLIAAVVDSLGGLAGV